MDEAYLKALEKNHEFKIFSGFGGSLETRIITAFVMNGVKIWMAKNYRTTKSELDMMSLKKMKLKKMRMYNEEGAFFLDE